MYQDIYYVNKTTDTISDALLAYGLAELIENIFLQAGVSSKIWIEDVGSCFRVHLEKPLTAKLLNGQIGSPRSSGLSRMKQKTKSLRAGQVLFGM